MPTQGPQLTYSEGGGLVLAHTTDLRRPFLCQPCPARQLLSASEIPRERRIIVGLSPLNLPRKPEGLMEHVRAAPAAPHTESHTARGMGSSAVCPAALASVARGFPGAPRMQIAPGPRQLADNSQLYSQEIKRHSHYSPHAPSSWMEAVGYL